MSRELRARLGSARLLLQALSDGDAHVVASRTQKVAFLNTLKAQGGTLSSEERADLMSMAAEVKWASDDCNIIMQALAPVNAETKKRSEMQKYTTITGFFTETEWAVLLDESGDLLSKREILMKRAIQLGAVVLVRSL